MKTIGKVEFPRQPATHCPLCLAMDIIVTACFHTGVRWDEDRYECLQCGAIWTTKPGIMFEDVKGGEK